MSNNALSKLDALLKESARSFHFSLKALPTPMRRPTSLAYALARLSDNIADGAAPKETRVFWLEQFRNYSVKQREIDWHNFESDFQPYLPEKDTRLFLAAPWLCNELKSFPQAIQRPIHQVWQSILKGQQFDLERWPSELPLSSDELEDYTFDVAGSVGEFWTEIGFITLGEKFSTCEKSHAIELGIQYGKSLQLINILRDAKSDRLLGRHYFHDSSSPLLLQSAQAGCHAGLAYADALKSDRLRFASTLPALLALEMLPLFLSNQANSAPIKLTKAHLFRILSECALRSLSAAAPN